MATMTMGHGSPACAVSPSGSAHAGSRLCVPPLRLLAAAAACTVLLAGCGAGASGPATASSASSSAPAAGPSASSPPSASTPTYPLTLTDDAHRTVTIKARPQRIVSLTLGTDEILFSLVAPGRIAAVTKFAADPTMSFVGAKVGSITQIASADAETVIALKPDLVFAADYTKPGVVQQLTDAGIPVVEFTTFSSIADVEAHVRTMGQITGDQAAAQKIVSDMDGEIARVGKAVSGQSHPRVVFYSGGYLYGTGTTIDEVIRDAGGDDAAADAGFKGWTKIDTEELVKLNPEVILTDASGTGDVDQGDNVRKLLGDPALQNVAAVKNKQVWGLSARADSDVGQFMAWDVQDVASVLHPAQVQLYKP